MKEGAARGPEFWDGLADHVTATVEPVLRRNRRAREPVIAYLRALKVLARRECDSREVIQIIASARRLLGGRDEIETLNEPSFRA
jgi:hypothetical protein